MTLNNETEPKQEWLLYLHINFIRLMNQQLWDTGISPSVMVSELSQQVTQRDHVNVSAMLPVMAKVITPINTKWLHLFFRRKKIIISTVFTVVVRNETDRIKELRQLLICGRWDEQAQTSFLLHPKRLLVVRLPILHRTRTGNKRLYDSPLKD